MNLNTPTRRVKRKFSAEDRQNLYDKWRSSGLTRTRFCKEHDLVLSVFTKWCREVSRKNNTIPQTNWIPLIPKESPSDPKQEMTTASIKIPKSTNILLGGLIVILFLRGLCDAIAVIW